MLPAGLEPGSRDLAPRALTIRPRKKVSRGCVAGFVCDFRIPKFPNDAAATPCSRLRGLLACNAGEPSFDGSPHYNRALPMVPCRPLRLVTQIVSRSLPFRSLEPRFRHTHCTFSPTATAPPLGQGDTTSQGAEPRREVRAQGPTRRHAVYNYNGAFFRQ